MITYTLRADNIVRCWAAGNVIYVIDGLKIQTPRRRKYALELCQLINPLLTDWRRRRPINGGFSLEWHSWIVIYRNHKLYSSAPMAVLVAKWGNRLRFIHSSISMILELLADCYHLPTTHSLLKLQLHGQMTKIWGITALSTVRDRDHILMNVCSTAGNCEFAQI